MSNQEQIDAYVDGALPPADRARFEAAMDADPALRAAVDGTLHLKSLAGQLGEVEPSRDLWPDVQAGLGAGAGRRPWGWVAAGVGGGTAALLAPHAHVEVSVQWFANADEPDESGDRPGRRKSPARDPAQAV